MAGLTGGREFYQKREPGRTFLTNIPERAEARMGAQVEPMPTPRGLVPIEQREAPQAPRTPQQERDNILSWGRENRKSPAEVTEVLRLHGVETIKPDEPAKAAPTIEIAEGIKQWNPESGLYDIHVGAGKAGKDVADKWNKDAAARLDKLYGTQTEMGIVVDPERMGEYQDANTYLADYKQKGLSGSDAAVLSARRAAAGGVDPIRQAIDQYRGLGKSDKEIKSLLRKSQFKSVNTRVYGLK